MSVIKIVPGETKIGWIGTGVMGSSMCGHLLDKGFTATCFTRSKTKAEGLLAKGAQWADSPQAVAENSDVVFTIVGFPQDVREVMLGTQGALAGSKKGNILVDMTTSEPSLAVEIADAAQAKEVHSVDAPVSGGDVGAREARLSIMIGGDREGGRCAPAVLGRHGKNGGSSGWGGRWPAHQNGQSNIDRHGHDWSLRGSTLRLQSGIRPAHGDGIGRIWCCWKLVVIESRPSNHRQ